MEDSINKLPRSFGDLPKRVNAAYSNNPIKMGKLIAYLLLIVGFACSNNVIAGLTDKVDLFMVNNIPVNVGSSHESTERVSDSDIVASNELVDNFGSDFIELLIESFKSASPSQIAAEQVNGGNDRDTELAELNANIDKLCHILIAYFIPAVLFFITVPCLLFYWAYESLKSERRLLNSIAQQINK